MFTIHEQPSNIADLNQRISELTSEIFSALSPRQESLVFPRGHCFIPNEIHQGKFYIVREGFLCFQLSDHTLLFFEKGDVIGWGDSLPTACKIVTDCDVVVDEFSKVDFLSHISNDVELSAKWAQFIDINHSLLFSFIAEKYRDEFAADPKTKHFRAGDVIIHEKEAAAEVFTLLHGTADVFVDDVQVGEVLSGEIFGAMAAAINTPRSATVKARTDCLVAVVEKDDFLNLVRTHPKTILKMFEDMSRVVISQNEKLAAKG
ncbi:MAG: cyclic nucleotide-binding domain-containing protein [Deltaproteobacteria bacterium]|nr:cyclic nucleotide-binding domain-containing protein [Deltaproteobacteria bacterium]